MINLGNSDREAPSSVLVGMYLEVHVEDNRASLVMKLLALFILTAWISRLT